MTLIKSEQLGNKDNHGLRFWRIFSEDDQEVGYVGKGGVSGLWHFSAVSAPMPAKFPGFRSKRAASRALLRLAKKHQERLEKQERNAEEAA